MVDDNKEQGIGASAQINQRIRIIEQRFEEFREHLDLIESNLLEKEKEMNKEINMLTETIRELRAEVKKTTEEYDKVFDKLDSFAPKEKLKVIERYINMLNPIDYVTKEEVEELISEKLEREEKDGSI